MIPDLINDLLPADCIDCSISEIENKFVNDFPLSNSRNSRFDGFIEYSKYICKKIKCTRRQLINGSFTTGKTDPYDVDFIIVINNNKLTLEEYLFLENEIKEENRRKEDYQVMKIEVKKGNKDINELYCCDAYFMLKREPNEGRLYKDYLEEKAYWLKTFGHTRKDKKTGKKYPKGILNLEVNPNTFEGYNDI